MRESVSIGVIDEVLSTNDEPNTGSCFNSTRGPTAGRVAAQRPTGCC